MSKRTTGAQINLCSDFAAVGLAVAISELSGVRLLHPLHREAHLIERIGWLRAAVLGANDGIISTSSLVVGVAAASTSSKEVMVAGVAGLWLAQPQWPRESMSR